MKYKLLAVSSWAFEHDWLIWLYQDTWPMTTLRAFPPNLKKRATPAGKWDALLRWLLVTVRINGQVKYGQAGEVGWKQGP